MPSGFHELLYFIISKADDSRALCRNDGCAHHATLETHRLLGLYWEGSELLLEPSRRVIMHPVNQSGILRYPKKKTASTCCTVSRASKGSQLAG